MASIQEKFAGLSPSGQNAAEAFIDFLLSLEEGEEKVTLRQEEGDQFSPFSSEPPVSTPVTTPEMPVSDPPDTKIILAEERVVDGEDNIIDFADINTRFTHKDMKGKESPQVRENKKIDWL